MRLSDPILGLRYLLLVGPLPRDWLPRVTVRLDAYVALGINWRLAQRANRPSRGDYLIQLSGERCSLFECELGANDSGVLILLRLKLTDFEDDFSVREPKAKFSQREVVVRSGREVDHSSRFALPSVARLG